MFDPFVNFSVWDLVFVIFFCSVIYILLRELFSGRLGVTGKVVLCCVLGAVGLFVLNLVVVDLTLNNVLLVELWGIKGWGYLGWTFLLPILAFGFRKKKKLFHYIFLALALPPVVQQLVTIFGGTYFVPYSAIQMVAWLIISLTGVLIGQMLCSSSDVRLKRQSSDSATRPTHEIHEFVSESATVNQASPSGTGFAVHRYYVLTASHVMKTSNSISIRHAHQTIDAELVATDQTNDLALLQLRVPIHDIAQIVSEGTLRQGSFVANYGHPGAGVLSDEAKISQGNVNGLAGMNNDSRFFQYDAPTQMGNSGGPVLNQSGDVVGIVTHALTSFTGSEDFVPQNVNFALKSYLIKGFLRSNDVKFESATAADRLNLADIADKARKFTVMIVC